MQWASLRFTPHAARWVAAEAWHPQQRGRWDAQGHWLLELPYADPRKLVTDILRHVPEVEVLAPRELRELVKEKLRAGLKKMRRGSSGETGGGHDGRRTTDPTAG